jgi:hypothetical protein
MMLHCVHFPTLELRPVFPRTAKYADSVERKRRLPTREASVITMSAEYSLTPDLER